MFVGLSFGLFVSSVDVIVLVERRITKFPDPFISPFTTKVFFGVVVVVVVELLAVEDSSFVFSLALLVFDSVSISEV